MTLEDGRRRRAGIAPRHRSGGRQYLRRFDDDEQTALVFWTATLGPVHQPHGRTTRLPRRPALRDRVLRAGAELRRHLQQLRAPRRDGGYYARAAESLGGQPGTRGGEFRRPSTRPATSPPGDAGADVRGDGAGPALFRRLLEEVINAGDVMPEQRLANQIAKRRAARLAQIDDLFGPEEPAGSTPEGHPRGAQGRGPHRPRARPHPQPRPQ